MKLHHADLIIPQGEEDEAREYYGKFLGLKEIEKPEVLKKNGGMWFELNGSQLHLSYERGEGFDPRKTKTHLAFQVDNLNFIEEKIKSEGYFLRYQTPIPGMKRLETEDPFGHKIEFLQAL